ncbi:hypothetical protein [Streptomyces sp. NPDC005141]
MRRPPPRGPRQQRGRIIHQDSAGIPGAVGAEDLAIGRGYEQGDAERGYVTVQ